MKKVFALVLALALCLSLLPAALAEGEDEGYPYPYQTRDSETKRWGLTSFIEGVGPVTVLPAEYDYVSGFTGDYATVQKDGLWGMVDTKGNFILPVEYCGLHISEEGIVTAARPDGGCGYLRTDGTPITDFCFTECRNFYKIGVCRKEVDGRVLYGAVNAQGETVIPFEYNHLSDPPPSYSSLQFIFATKDGCSGAFDASGDLLRRCIYPNDAIMQQSLALPPQMTAEEEMSALIAASQTWWVEQDPGSGLWGYRFRRSPPGELTDMDWAFRPSFLSAQPFDETGHAQVTLEDGQIGTIDQSGNFTPAPRNSQFSDVPAGSWFEQGVALCAQSGIMVGTGEGQFSPNAVLTQAECLTLALRLYDLQRDGSGAFLSAPEGAGYMTLTLQDGTVFEGYGTSSSPFWTWAWRNGNWGVCVKPLGETSEEQEAWGKAHEGSAVFTVEGTEYPGTVHCWIPTGGWALMFQPSDLKNGYALLGGAVSSGIPAPGVWWRDAVYTAHQWGLDYQSAPGINDLVNPYLEEGRPARREEFAKALFDAAGELEQLYTVDWLPDLERSEWSESIFRLYEAGILGGVDNLGTFHPYGELTRAEAAVMVARVLDPSLRLKEPPQTVGAYERAVLKLRNGDNYRNEQSFDSPTSTVFLFDGGVYWGVGNLVLIGKADFAKGEGELITLPCPQHGVFNMVRPAASMELSEDKKAFTYSYHFDEPLGTGDGSRIIRAAGDFIYTLDLTTGEVTEEYIPLG